MIVAIGGSVGGVAVADLLVLASIVHSTMETADPHVSPISSGSPVLNRLIQGCVAVDRCVGPMSDLVLGRLKAADEGRPRQLMEMPVDRAHERLLATVLAARDCADEPIPLELVDSRRSFQPSPPERLRHVPIGRRGRFGPSVVAIGGAPRVRR